MREAPAAIAGHSSEEPLSTDQSSGPTEPSRELSDEELSTLFATDALPYLDQL